MTLARAAGRQRGVVSRGQLRAMGITDASIANAVAVGRLHRVFRGVFAVGHREIGRQGEMLAAVLACGAGTVVSHRTAAELLGLWQRPTATVDVIAPAGSGRGIDGIRTHHVAPPDSGEVGCCDGVPCTSPSRTLVDLAGTIGERSLRQTVERAAALGLLDVAATERSLARARRRGAPTLRSILRDWKAVGYGPSATAQDQKRASLRSSMEARLLALIGASGLPAPRCNHEVEVGGDRFEVDFLWLEERLVVETDGRRYHAGPAAFESDRRRDRVLQVGGYRVIRLTLAQIERETDAVTSAIGRVLAMQRQAVTAKR